MIALGCPPLGALLGIVSAVQASRRGRSPVLGYVAIAVAVASAVIGTIMVANG